ncbi:Amino acid transporter, transmembrane domain containing protein [Trema orientale]|uniref:Amino acid transporter, transmembrane domain containing protein n=1 Tax=Trema orientale TaxID=63057 RepID=A0A2P5A413_TREOI|nr:Amino acid transporter, transmembrane domain containing protein [Trema orientale]
MFNEYICKVYAQPLYRKVEDLSKKWWPESDFVVKDYPIWVPFLGTYNLNLFRSVWRTFFVAVTTTLSITFPFFNDVVGLIGALVFWPLTVYFPIEMHITQKKIRKSWGKWFGLKLVSGVCLIVSILAATGSITGIAKELKTYRPFMSI